MANTVILSARQSFEFLGDGIRLTAMSLPDVIDSVRRHFSFQRATLNRPPATFGLVPNTIPPGVVFHVGTWNNSEMGSVMIRFLHVEAQRIVFDIAGPSEALPKLATEFFETVRRSAKTVDGSAAVGESHRVLDYSELTVQLPASLDVLWTPKFRKLAKTVSSVAESEDIIPSVSFHVVEHAVPHPGDSVAGGTGYQLSLRRQTLPSDYIYFSGAPLATTPHKAYLEELHKIVTDMSHKSSR